MVCAAAFAYPFFWLLDTGDTTYVWLAFTLCGLLLGAQAGFLTALFATRTRYSGVALSREVAAALAGGTASLLASALLQAAGGRPWPVAVYMSVLLLLSVVAVALLPCVGRSEHDRVRDAGA